MLVLEILLMIASLSLIIICSITDLQKGMIYNKHLMVFASISVVLNFIYYGAFAQNFILEYFFNLIIIVVISCFLFYSHSYAGGDTKMTIVLASLYPARYYIEYNESSLTLFFSIAFAFLIGYFFLLNNSIYGIINKTIPITKDYFINHIVFFLKRYLCALLYISLINLLVLIISKNGIIINVWFIRLICFILTFVISKYEVLRNKYSISAVFVLVLVGSIYSKEIPVSINVEDYFLILFLMFCQLFIKSNIYETVSVDELKKGMILTTESSFLCNYQLLLDCLGYQMKV